MSRLPASLFVAPLLTMALLAGLPSAGAQEIVPEFDASRLVTVSEISSAGGVVSAVLDNKSPRLVRDVRVLIRYIWLWKNERNPGDDSPARAAYHTVSGEIPAGGTLPFTYHPDPPLPQRSDGHFEVAAEVVGFTEVGK